MATEVVTTILVFKPGEEIGITHSNSIVINVRPGMQADRLGVKQGMRLVAVSGKIYSLNALRDAQAGSKPYEVVFANPKMVMFKPGQIGAAWEAQTGEIKRVAPIGQAQQAGVRCGMRMQMVADTPYSEDTLNRAMDGAEKYNILFSAEAPVGVGDAVVASENFNTDDKEAVLVSEGAHGVVRGIYDDDALIQWDGDNTLHWLFEEKFDCIKIRHKASFFYTEGSLCGKILQGDRKYHNVREVQAACSVDSTCKGYFMEDDGSYTRVHVGSGQSFCRGCGTIISVRRKVEVSSGQEVAGDMRPARGSEVKIVESTGEGQAVEHFPKTIEDLQSILYHSRGLSSHEVVVGPRHIHDDDNSSDSEGSFSLVARFKAGRPMIEPVDWHWWDNDVLELLVAALQADHVFEKMSFCWPTGSGVRCNAKDQFKDLGSAVALSPHLKSAVFFSFLPGSFWRTFSNSVPLNSTLLSLELADTVLPEPLQPQVFTALGRNKTLQHLAICSDTYQWLDTEAFSHMISQNKSLHCIRLKMYMRFDVGKQVAKSLRGNSTLKKLEMFSLAFDEDDVDHLNEARDSKAMIHTLKHYNSTLQSLGSAQVGWKWDGTLILLPSTGVRGNLFLSCPRKFHMLLSLLQRNRETTMHVKLVSQIIAQSAHHGFQENVSKMLLEFLLPQNAKSDNFTQRNHERRLECPAMPVVQDVVDYTYEAPAVIPPEEAHRIQTEMWATGIQHNAEDSVNSSTQASEQLLLIKLKRCPAELMDELAHGTSLRAARQALEAAGFSWKLSCGAHVFVDPSQYVKVLDSLPANLMSSHVAVAGSMEHLLEEAMARIGKGSVASDRKEIPMMPAVSSVDAASNSQDILDLLGPVSFGDLIEYRTFLTQVSKGITHSHESSCTWP